MILDFRFKPLELLALVAFPICYFLTKNTDFGFIIAILASGVIVPYGIYNGFTYIGRYEQNLPIFSIESVSFTSVWIWASFFAFRFIGFLYIYTVIPLVAFSFFVALVVLSVKHKKIIAVPFVGALAYTLIGLYLCWQDFMHR